MILEELRKAVYAMRKNCKIAIHGCTLILIPYRRDHVEKYHGWMQSEDLRNETASEKLTLKEEYEMQQAWNNDDEKCTFIILAKSLWEETRNEIDSMVGDVNLFMNEDCSEAEIEVMIAEKSARKCGIGTEAVLAMIYYGTQHLGIEKYFAIIGNNNQSSQCLFSKVGFHKVKETPVFNECTYELTINDRTFHQKFYKQISALDVCSYPMEDY